MINQLEISDALYVLNKEAKHINVIDAQVLYSIKEKVINKVLEMNMNCKRSVHFSKIHEKNYLSIDDATDESEYHKARAMPGAHQDRQGLLYEVEVLYLVMDYIEFGGNGFHFNVRKSKSIPEIGADIGNDFVSNKPYIKKPYTLTVAKEILEKFLNHA